MDVTPQLLKDVEFREKFRGYDPDEVDDFLERVGAAFAQMQDKLRDANDQIESANARAARAEARARDSSDIDDTLRRTLVLAQRTADAAIKEAEEQAASIVAEAQASSRQQLSSAEERASQTLAAAESEARRKQDAADAQSKLVLTNAEAQAEQTMGAAREQANRLLMDARRQAEQIVTEARSSADRVAEERREALTTEVNTLEARREALVRNVDLLDTHVGAQRERLELVVNDLRILLDEPDRLAMVPERPELVDEPAVIKAPPLPTEPDLSAPTETEVDVAQAHGGPVDLAGGRPEGESAAAADTDLEHALPSSDTGVEEAPSAALAHEDDTQLMPPLLLASPDEGAAGTTVAERPAEADEGDRTQPIDLTALEYEQNERQAEPTGAPTTPGGPGAQASPAGASPVVPPSTWPAGGPPPPPPPPRPADRRASEPLSEPPAPPPPPAPTGRTDDPSVPPWLSTRGPAPSPPPAPSPKSDAFLDELRRAVGDDPNEDPADEAAKRFFEDRDPTDPATRFLEDPDDSTNRTWFGRRR